MLSYKINCRVLDPQEPRNSALRLVADVPDGGHSRTVAYCQQQITKYPLLWIPKVKKVAQKFKKDVSTIDESTPKVPEGLPEVEIVKPEDQIDSSFQIDVQIDFGKWFTWLERGIWLTMVASIIWALLLDTSKATDEVCLKNGTNHYPSNFLPSLSRTMGSFRVGTLFWTICMAACFIARLMSNYFIHKLYEAWYDTNLWNVVYLKAAYILDNLEIISLIMIPAYNLDCDAEAHRAAFIVYLVLTYIAEVLQYFTRFLRRKKGIMLDTRDISTYYRQIGILIILQTVFLLWMLTGFLLHEHICGDYHFTIFTLGEYLTVIVNVRFKRDTILFVR